MLNRIPPGLEHVMNIDPEILGGEPCFNGTRVPLESVLDNLGAGYRIDEIISDFPTLTEGHVCAVQRWELTLAREAAGFRATRPLKLLLDEMRTPRFAPLRAGHEVTLCPSWVDTYQQW